MGNVIRIYDDRQIFYNILRDHKVINKVIQKADVRIEYCTVDEQNHTYLRYCSYRKAPNSKSVASSSPMTNWDLEPDDIYHVFLDTLWLEENLPLGEKRRTRYGDRKYPYALGKNLKQNQVQSLTVYTTSDTEAADILLKDLNQYKEEEPDQINPIIIQCPLHIYFNDPFIDKYLLSPLQE